MKYLAYAIGAPQVDRPGQLPLRPVFLALGQEREHRLIADIFTAYSAVRRVSWSRKGWEAYLGLGIMRLSK